ELTARRATARGSAVAGVVSGMAERIDLNAFRGAGVNAHRPIDSRLTGTQPARVRFSGPALCRKASRRGESDLKPQNLAGSLHAPESLPRRLRSGVEAPGPGVRRLKPRPAGSIEAEATRILPHELRDE